MAILGIDTGGRFTDFALFDGATKALHSFKANSTPAGPGAALETGLARLGDELGVEVAALERLVFGTTVGDPKPARGAHGATLPSRPSRSAR